MSDRELLELAAKAAGINVSNWREGHGFCPPELHEHHKFYWNPLTDDGDALRLAVSCELHVDVSNDSLSVYYWLNSDGCESADEDYNGDPYAATRRAIVRAAAELGRTK